MFKQKSAGAFLAHNASEGLTDNRQIGLRDRQRSGFYR